MLTRPARAMQLRSVRFMDDAPRFINGRNDQIGLKSAETGALITGRPHSSHRLTNPDG